MSTHEEKEQRPAPQEFIAVFYDCKKRRHVIGILKKICLITNIVGNRYGYDKKQSESKKEMENHNTDISDYFVVLSVLLCKKKYI